MQYISNEAANWKALHSDKAVAEQAKVEMGLRTLRPGGQAGSGRFCLIRHCLSPTTTTGTGRRKAVVSAYVVYVCVPLSWGPQRRRTTRDLFAFLSFFTRTFVCRRCTLSSSSCVYCHAEEESKHLGRSAALPPSSPKVQQLVSLSSVFLFLSCQPALE